MLTDECNHVRWARDRGQVGVEDEFCNSRGGLNLGLENIRLQRIQEALLEQIGRHLIRYCLSGLDEHLVGDALRLGGENRHTDSREDVEIVGLSWEECLSVVVDRRKLHACRVDGFALRPCVRLLGRAFGMLGGVRERKDYRALVDPGHCLDYFLIEGSANGANADEGGGPDAGNRGGEIACRRVLMRVWQLEIEEVLAGGLEQTVDIEHVDAGLSVLERHALRHERRTKQVGKSN